MATGGGRTAAAADVRPAARKGGAAAARGGRHRRSASEAVALSALRGPGPMEAAIAELLHVEEAAGQLPGLGGYEQLLTSFSSGEGEAVQVAVQAGGVLSQPRKDLRVAGRGGADSAVVGAVGAAVGPAVGLAVGPAASLVPEPLTPDHSAAAASTPSVRAALRRRAAPPLLVSPFAAAVLAASAGVGAAGGLSSDDVPLTPEGSAALASGVLSGGPGVGGRRSDWGPASPVATGRKDASRR